jgi:preprotein translocase subunit SecE
MAKEEKKSPVAAPAKAAVRREDKKPNIFRRLAKWLREMRSELKKVLWPTPKQIVNNTGVALFFMVVAAIVIWGFDQLADRAILVLITITG